MRQTWIPGVSSPVPLYAPYSPLIPMEVARRVNPSRRYNNRPAARLAPPRSPSRIPSDVPIARVMIGGARKVVVLGAAGVIFAFPFVLAYHGDSLIGLEVSTPLVVSSIESSVWYPYWEKTGSGET